MTFEEMQKTMDFILNQQAKNEVEIQELRGTVGKLASTVSDLAVKIDNLTDAQIQTNDNIDTLTQAQIQNTADIGRLVNIVENTRDFALDIARLAKVTEKRVERLENREAGD
jgi:hypothetical protein